MARSICVAFLWFVLVIPPVFYKVGKADNNLCGYDSLTFAVNDTAVMCVKCQECPPGFGISVECGSLYLFEEKSTILKRNKCEACPKETFSPSFSRGFCHKCTNCAHGSTVLRNCTPTQDSVCGPCKSGYYRDELTSSCMPCSRCCGNDNDDVIKECVTQEPQSNKHCSLIAEYRCLKRRVPTPTTFTEIHSGYFKIFLSRTEKNDQDWQLPTITSYRETDGFIRLFAVLLALGVLIFVISVFFMIFMYRRKKPSRKQRQCFSSKTVFKRKEVAYRSRSDQSDELEDWSNNEISNSSYSFKCGVHVKYEPHSKQDRYKNLIVEALSEQAMDSHFRSIKPGQIFLSPIYRFYTRGEKFKEPVKVSLPHSALYTSEQMNWDVEILCMDERKGKEAKWERITDGLEVNWKDTSFYTDTLLTYAVVGKPLKGAKKRMQFVLFTTGEMMSDLFEMSIHLLDDNETSFQNLLKENSSKGFTMLGSFYTAFVDCHDSDNINVNVEGLLDGWELDHLKPKTIPSSDCKESYFSIPSFQGAFRRVKRYADKFSCKFRIDVAGTEILIPAFTFVPEEELCVVVDVHDQDHDTSVLKEKTTPFKDLHYDTKYILGRMLDVSVKGQGTWRQLGRHFRLADDEVEQFSVEYRTLEGSPSRALFDYLSTTQPSITVGEFAKCLESLGREDVMAVLYKQLKKKPLNIKI